MGTPHAGGEGVSWGRLALNLASIINNTKAEYLEVLERNSKWLEQQQVQYNSISRKFDTKFFYEMYETRLPGGGKLLVCVSVFPRSEGNLDADICCRLYRNTRPVLQEL